MSALTLALPALRCRGSGAPRRAAARCSAAAAPRVLPCAGAPVLAGRASPLRACVAARSSRLRATRRVVLAAQASAEGKQLVQDEEQSITKVSFGTIGLSVGVTLLLAGFLGYFNFIKISDNSLSALLLIYGFPISLIGFALKYAELKPLVCESYADAVALRATQATPILLQVRSDVTRFRYGDEQHLDEALLRIFRINKSGGIRRNQAPVLARLREEVVDGKYALVLGFDSQLPMPEWETRAVKFESFFGPGIRAKLTQIETGVDVALISDGTAAGGIAEDQEVLPPLMPGLAPRVVKKAPKSE